MGRYVKEEPTSRFNCVCGLTMTAPTEALKHALSGHECMYEEYRGGKWRNSGYTASDLIIMGKQARGEDIPTFISRIRYLENQYQNA